MVGNQVRADGQKRDSTLVTVISVLSLAVSLFALIASFIPYLSGVAVFLGAPAVFGALVAAGVALLRKNRLAVPAIALIAAGLPAARYNWQKMRVVWVESAELCHPPELQGFSLFAFLGTLAMSMDHKNAVGTNICEQLSRNYADSDCDGDIGRIKCE